MDKNQLKKNAIHKERAKSKKPSIIVSTVKCDSYEQGEVDKAVSRLLENIGGLNSIIRPYNKVHIKPNLLTAKPPEKAATTHPAVVLRQ